MLFKDDILFDKFTMKNCFLACFYSFLMCLFLISCQSNEEIIAEKIELITSNQEEWDDFNQKVLNKDFDDASFPLFIDIFDSTLKKEAEKKGIVYFIITKSGKCKSIEYGTNWTDLPNGISYLHWSSCPDETNQRGYYNQTNFIETWGVGNGWSILVDSDWK